MESDYIGSWPGKSPQNPGDQPHPALYHMIDVAAVAEIFLQSSDQPSARRQALILLTALHDLGKIGSAFRDCVLRDLPQINGSHWKVAEALLRHHDAELRTVLGIERQSRRFSLYAASAGHHGRPPAASPEDLNRMLKFTGQESILDSGAHRHVRWMSDADVQAPWFLLTERPAPRQHIPAPDLGFPKSGAGKSESRLLIIPAVRRHRRRFRRWVIITRPCLGAPILPGRSGSGNFSDPPDHKGFPCRST